MISMSITDKYKFVPRTAIFSKKIIDPEGISKRIIEICFHLGRLSSIQFNVLMALKNNKNIDINDSKIEGAINKLVKAKIITPK